MGIAHTEEAVARPKGDERMARYDKTYCEDKNRFKDTKCKHETMTVYDMRFNKNNQPTHVKDICVICGKISTWGEFNYKKHPPVATMHI